MSGRSERRAGMAGLGRTAMPVLLLLSLAGPRAEELTDLNGLLAQAERVQKEDIAAWTRFGFHRHHVKEFLDADGQVTETLDLEFDVTPAAKGFDELLVRRDGRAPTENEAKQGRRDAKFSKHYATMLSGDAEDDEEGAYS